MRKAAHGVQVRNVTGHDFGQRLEQEEVTAEYSARVWP
jgi:hypothetical protein